MLRHDLGDFQGHSLGAARPTGWCHLYGVTHRDLLPLRIDYVSVVDVQV
ncbi:MAG: hypothetical protein WBA79_21575 [Mycobacterium sp.]